MQRRKMIALSLMSVILVAGCDAIGAAKTVAAEAVRDQIKSEIELAVGDVVSNAIDVQSLLPQDSE